MSDHDFRKLVREMRDVQKRFFRGDKSAVTEARRLEVAVDDELAGRTPQPTLFDNPGDVDEKEQHP